MGIYKKRKNYYIDYYVNGERKRECIGTDKRLAETVLKKRKVEIAEGRYLDKKKLENIKFEDFSEEFLTLYSKPNKKSWQSDFYNLKSTTPFFKGKNLYEITVQDVEKFKAHRSKLVKPSTVNRELATTKTLFNKAVEWGKLEQSPAKKVKFLREPGGRLRYLEKDQIQKLLSNSSERIRPIITLALFTGMRRGEILKLKWQDMDFQRGIIYLLDTKNGAKREVFMNELVRKALIKVRKHPDSSYIFCDKKGKPYHDIRKSFWTALNKSGILNFRFHDLRHTFASQLVMSGIDINTVRELLGHKDIRMTLRYSHLSQDYKRRAVDILERQMDTIRTPRSIYKT
ncbi:tyrosine-type recombinase/integrase, partial [Candidatus Omnitrophota bacterium]